MPDPPSPGGWARRFFWGCVLVLLGVAAIRLALDLLARMWPWLVLIAVLTVGIVGAIRWLSSRRDRW